MQKIQTNIINFEFAPDRCRYCNTNCNDGKCEQNWQTAEEKCGQGGGCSALYGCLCYFMGSDSQANCSMVGCAKAIQVYIGHM